LRGTARIGVTVRAALTAVSLCALALAAPAGASPVADTQEEYTALGRVFPDPLAGCQNAGSSPCSPFAQGNVPATQFVGYEEFIAGLRFLNSKPEWRRYLEVWPLDGKIGDGSGTKPGNDMFPGNTLDSIEFKPRSDFESAGIATSGTGRRRSDLIVARVTDENVPDKGKKRYTLSLSIHGIERAGAEGGIRAIEDLVTAGTLGTAGRPILPKDAGPSPTFGETLRNTIIYFTFPNPDGWRRGSVSEGGVFFQRYNGNGVDLNRDWADIGFQHRYYSATSEPETRAFDSFYRNVEASSGQFTAGDDLHGQAEDDALSFTLLPHGRHDYSKDLRIRNSAIKIHNATYEMVKWSPIVQPNDAPRGGNPVGCAPGAIGDNCAKIYGQTWGTVYDTINYTTAGTLGDWFDSSTGLGADGIDNEMSFSHLDKNIVFDPHTEQMHVDGNKALIYAHVSSMLNPASGRFDAPGRKGYVPNTRLKRSARSAPPPPEGTVPQATVGPENFAGTYSFKVKEGDQPPGGADGGKKIFNGGMRIDVRGLNAQGVGASAVSLAVQCRGCDKHRERAAQAGDEWVTVGEDFNQSPLYAQAGLTVAINNPQTTFTDKAGKPQPVEWRAVLSPGEPASVEIHFSSGPAADDGNTGGDDPPNLAAYDVANTDLFPALNRDMEPGVPDFESVDPSAVIGGRKKLDGLDSLVLADDPFPSYKGSYGVNLVGQKPDDFDIASSPTVPGAYDPSTPADERTPGTYTLKEFKLAEGQAAGGAKVRIDWASETDDFDMYLYRKLDNGKLLLIGSSHNAQLDTNWEEIDLKQPIGAGTYQLYVDNFAAVNPTWSGKVSFRPVEPTPSGSASDADKGKWLAAVRKWVEGGGNLVLTDGALRALPELTSIPPEAIARTTVYAGQVTFDSEPGKSTVKDPLAQKPVTIEQPGARFNIGNRRQIFEPTPLGFPIQPDTRSNADASFAYQWHVDKAAFEAAGGRVAGTSVDAEARDAAPVHDRVTLGEVKVGKGQVRILGGALPQPTTEYNHPYGLEPYALTYTGFILVRNLLEVPSILSSPTIGGRFLISGRAVKMRKNAAAVRVSCRRPFRCTGRLTLQTVVRQRSRKTRKVVKRRVTLGSVKFNIGNKQRNRVLQVPIAKSARKYVLRTRRVNVLATAPIKFADGKRGTARNDFWLYRPTSRALRARR
jgi:hypothetical protein